VTRSEIPQLEVVTAIPDADREDFLAQLLFSQGWNIIYRAFDANSLMTFMKQRGSGLRTVVVYESQLPGFSADLLQELDEPANTVISLDSVGFTSHEMMAAIRGNLRAPMLQTTNSEELFVPEDSAPADFATFPQNRKSRDLPINPAKRIHRNARMQVRERKVIVVTGTTGAPGRTRFATALSRELAMQGATLLIDADIRSHGVIPLRDELTKSAVEVIPLDREKRPTHIPDGGETAVVDLGVLPGLAEATADRRWHGSLVNNVLDRATHLVYLSKSTAASMTELSQFMREYPLLQKRLPVLFVCILAGHSRELREWEARFLTLTTGESRYILRESQLATSKESKIFGAMKVKDPKRREIAKIAASLA
jgi:type II secretory pathway component PulJ